MKEIKTEEDWEEHVQENGRKPATIVERIELAIHDYEGGSTAIWEQTPESRELHTQAREVYLQNRTSFRDAVKAARVFIIESILRKEGLIK